MLRGKIRINKRTLRRMLRKPGLTVQLPYAQLKEATLPPAPPALLGQVGALERRCDVCVCARVPTPGGFLSLTVLKWKYRV